MSSNSTLVPYAPSGTHTHTSSNSTLAPYAPSGTHTHTSSNPTLAPVRLQDCPANLAITIEKCMGEIWHAEVPRFVAGCKRGLATFKSACDRCLCEVIHSASRDQPTVIATIRQAITDETPYPVLIRRIQAIGSPSNVFFQRLIHSLQLPFENAHGIAYGLGLGAAVTLLGCYYARRGAPILARRPSPFGYEYLLQSALPFCNNLWHLSSTISRTLTSVFDAVIETPKEIIAKRAVDHNGNPCAIESAMGMQYLLRAEGWCIGNIADVWVGQQELNGFLDLVNAFEKGVGRQRGLVQAVPLGNQRPAGGRARDGLGRFV